MLMSTEMAAQAQLGACSFERHARLSVPAQRRGHVPFEVLWLEERARACYDGCSHWSGRRVEPRLQSGQHSVRVGEPLLADIGLDEVAGPPHERSVREACALCEAGDLFKMKQCRSVVSLGQLEQA